MSSNECIKKYFSNSNESCYIDSLFVSLFHSKNIFIDNFVNNLEINNTDNQDLYIYATLILSGIQDIYKKLQTKDNSDKQVECTNIRNNIQQYYNIENNGNQANYNFLRGEQNPIDLLKYLTDKVFKKIDNILYMTLDIREYNNNYYDNGFNGAFDEKVIFDDINFITIINQNDNDNEKIDFKEKIDSDLYDIKISLYLHSIIVNTGNHYVCYYKCNNKWYYYDDLKFNHNNFITFIDTIGQVNEHVNEKIKTMSRKECILLYLKQEEEADEELQLALQLSQEQQKEADEQLQLALQLSQEQQEQREQTAAITTHTNNKSIIQLEKLIKNYIDILNKK